MKAESARRAGRTGSAGRSVRGARRPTAGPPGRRSKPTTGRPPTRRAPAKRRAKAVGATARLEHADGHGQASVHGGFHMYTASSVSRPAPPFQFDEPGRVVWVLAAGVQRPAAAVFDEIVRAGKWTGRPAGVPLPGDHADAGDEERPPSGSGAAGRVAGGMTDGSGRGRPASIPTPRRAGGPGPAHSAWTASPSFFLRSAIAFGDREDSRTDTSARAGSALIASAALSVSRGPVEGEAAAGWEGLSAGPDRRP